MPKFRLTLLGGFRLEDEDGREIFVKSRKTQGVLSVLALSAAGTVTREHNHWRFNLASVISF